MSQKYNYYGIVGSNGYGIVKYWSQCSKCLKYFKAVQQKGFYTKEDAYKWIKRRFVLHMYLMIMNLSSLKIWKGESWFL